MTDWGPHSAAEGSRLRIRIIVICEVSGTVRVIDSYLTNWKYKKHHTNTNPVQIPNTINSGVSLTSFSLSLHESHRPVHCSDKIRVLFL